MNRFSLYSLTIVFVLTVGSVWADDMVVIRDYGNTRPSGIPSTEDIQRLARQMNVQPSEIRSFSPYAFPIESEKMRLGNLEQGSIEHGKSGVQPFFIIGADSDSQAWLKRNKQYLIDEQINRGLLTNVESAHAFKRMTDLAYPLELHPLNTDEIAAVFGVYVYPIVISETEIAQ